MQEFNQFEIEAQILDFMRSLHIEPLDNIHFVFDGNIHRYKVAGDKGSEKAGAYCFWTEHWPAGWVYNWRTGEHSSWCFNREALTKEKRDALSEAEYQELLQKAKIAQAKMMRETMYHRNISYIRYIAIS